MNPVLGVAALWLAFAGTHIGLASRRVRPALVARLGEWGFVGVFSVVASICFAALVSFYADHRFAGPPGLALGAIWGLRSILMAVVFLGVVLAAAALHSYPASPYALGNSLTHEPRGIERVTRHPFFVGMAMIGGAHALLASHLVGTVFFAVLAIYALVGAIHQDRKLLAQRGRPYADYLAATSMVPMAAVASGRQRIAPDEIPWSALATSVLVAALLATVHASIFAHGGVWVIVSTVGGAAVLAFRSWRRATRTTARRRGATATT